MKKNGVQNQYYIGSPVMGQRYNSLMISSNNGVTYNYYQKCIESNFLWGEIKCVLIFNPVFLFKQLWKKYEYGRFYYLSKKNN